MPLSSLSYNGSISSHSSRILSGISKFEHELVQNPHMKVARPHQFHIFHQHFLQLKIRY